MSDETKVEYVPSQTQRFEISEDSFSQERLHILLEAFHTLKEEFPFFAGISLYGSLSKGKNLNEDTAGKSDIDFVLFLDRDDLQENLEQLKAVNIDFDIAIEEVLKDPRIKVEELDKSEIDRINIEFAAEEFVKKRAKDLIGQKAKGVKIAAYTECISMRDGTSTFHRLDRHEEESDRFNRIFKRPEKKWDPSIGPLFMLDIGGGLSKYRDAFFDRLAQEKPERADALWAIVNRHIRSWERKSDIPPILEYSFPATFEDAREYYQSGRPLITQL